MLPRATHFFKKWTTLLDQLTENDKKDNPRISTKQDYQPFMETFKEWCPSDKYHKILNVGTGSGLEAVLLYQNGYKVEAINYNEEIDSVSREISEESWKKVTDLFSAKQLFFRENIDMHQLYSGEYDAIFCLQTLEHALAPYLVLLEFRCALRDFGRVYVDLPDANDKIMLTTIQHVSVLYSDQWQALFLKAGFKLIKDLSVRHRLGFIFEKLPLHYISDPGLKALLEAYEKAWNT